MTEEQRKLLDLAEESLRAAELLHNNGVHRFAVSRSYYTMFYCAEALLLEKQMAFSKHSAVIAAFGKEYAKPGLIPHERHRHLIEAAEMREDGDYDVSATIGDADCAEQLTRARTFLDESMAYILRQKSSQ